MKWMEWTEEKLEHLKDATWMCAAGAELLLLLNENKVVIGDESYLYSGNPARFDRIISMCSWIEFPDQPVAGAKWISSRAKNVKFGWPRGGAVTILNNATTGFPILAYEGSLVSLGRTAMVNCLALRSLFDGGPMTAAFIGAGRVNEWQARYMRQLWPKCQMFVYDLDTARALRFVEKIGAHRLIHWRESLNMEVVSLATAGETAVGWISWREDIAGPKVWLHTSLRDMQPRLEQKFPLVVVDDHTLATSQGTTHSFAWRENWVQKELSLIDLVVNNYKPSRSDFPALVTPMGLAMWDVGIGFRLFEEEFFDEMNRCSQFEYKEVLCE